MQQLSLFDDMLNLAGVMPSVKAAMRRIAGEGDECRKGLVDKLNRVAAQEEIRLTGGNAKTISLDTLNKILSPSDTGHPPSLHFILAFWKATKDPAPLRIIVRAAGFELMTDEDKFDRDYGKAVREEKAARKRRTQLEGRL